MIGIKYRDTKTEDYYVIRYPIFDFSRCDGKQNNYDLTVPYYNVVAYMPYRTLNDIQKINKEFEFCKDIV
jgi:hypothetical protein